jgi:hypothetical protein
MVLGLVLMTLAALPFLLTGVYGLVTITATGIAGGLSDLEQQLVLLLGLVVAFALGYLLFAVMAFRGRNWARILVTVLNVGFVLLLIGRLPWGNFGLLGLPGLFLIVALVSGVVILFLPDANRYFSRPR